MFCKLVAFAIIWILLHQAGFGAEGSVRTMREEVSPREDVTSDIPRNWKNSTWVVIDTINGVKISTNGAPVVKFFQGEPVIVGSVPVGTQLQMDRVRSYGPHNYWPVVFQNQQGQEEQGWISGLFVRRQE